MRHFSRCILVLSLSAVCLASAQGGRVAPYIGDAAAIRKQIEASRKAHLSLRSLAGDVQMRLTMGRDTLNFTGGFAFAKPNRAKAKVTVSGPLAKMGVPIPEEMQVNGKPPARLTVTSISDGVAHYILREPNRGKYVRQPAKSGLENIASVLDDAIIGNAVTRMYLNADQILPGPFIQRLQSVAVSEKTRDGVLVVIYEMRAKVGTSQEDSADRAVLVVGKKDNVVRELRLSGPVQGMLSEVTFTTKNLRVNPALPPTAFAFTPPKGMSEVRQSAP